MQIIREAIHRKHGSSKIAEEKSTTAFWHSSAYPSDHDYVAIIAYGHSNNTSHKYWIQLTPPEVLKLVMAIPIEHWESAVKGLNSRNLLQKIGQLVSAISVAIPE